jgi:hypothetical protein
MTMAARLEPVMIIISSECACRLPRRG